VGAVEGLLARCDFPPAGTRVTCAVSGGPDSLALLVLACAALGEDAVTAVHVDHGLRPGSAAEAEVVRRAAERFGAGFRAVTVHVEPGPNLEARARAARYAALPPAALTGHTADDQAETVLLNLLRGAGLDGLGGMAPERRPLRRLRRAETHALCGALGLDPVLDPSNDDPAFRRNRVRRELLPMLDDVAARDVVPVLARQADLLRDDAQLLGELAAALDPTDGRALAAAPPALARRAVRRWLREAAGGPEQHPPDAAAVERVLAVARSEAVACEVGGGGRVARTRGRLRLEPPPDPVPEVHAGSDRATTLAAMSEPRRATPHFDDPALGEIVVSADEIAARIAELGAEITRDYADEPQPPVLVCVLKGAFVFLADLVRQIRLPIEVDFMAVSSYGASTKSSGVVRIVKDLEMDLRGRHVVLVEDIVDSGLTLSYLTKNLMARDPASLEVCALFVRQGNQKTSLKLRYVGFEIPPSFVLGYGLDVAERFRNLPYVCKHAEHS
jgi:hypoxanthine phosphoribosyltransferase